MTDVIKEANYKRIYVWELPIRFFHWINALCIFVLAITGIIIGDPPMLSSSKEAYQQYWFGAIRFTHFVTAWIFTINFLFRIYWGFVGNHHARWKSLFPNGEKLKELVEVFRVDIFQLDIKGKISIGHNALASISYLLLFLLIIFSIASGFALYHPLSESWFPGLFAWITKLFGSESALRQWHHIATWGYVFFVLGHVYLVFYHDYIEGRGTMSSMIGGWKFEKEEYLNDK